MKILIAILTSGKLEKLERCLSSILSQVNKRDVVIIINTLNDEYASDAMLLANSLEIKSVITTSNGKPGKGKNELIQYFLSTDFTHVIPVDGDDILLPKAVGKLATLVHATRTDVVGLVNGLALLTDEQLLIEDWYDTETYKKRITEEINQKDFKKFNWHLAKIRKVATECDNFFNRIVILSRTAAQYVKYDERLHGAEDIKQGLLLKLLHYNGKLKYLILNSSKIYLYDVTDLGVYFQLLCKANPTIEISNFWENLNKEHTQILTSFQLEYIND